MCPFFYPYTCIWEFQLVNADEYTIINIPGAFAIRTWPSYVVYVCFLSIECLGKDMSLQPYLQGKNT